MVLKSYNWIGTRKVAPGPVQCKHLSIVAAPSDFSPLKLLSFRSLATRYTFFPSLKFHDS